MATQTDVQQLIQGLTPSGVNNGNPNTAYNFAPPTQDAQGNWFGGGVGPAASITALNLTPRTPWTPPENTGVPGGNLLDLLPSIPEGGIPMNPGWTPTPAPTPAPAPAPQPGGPVTGGGKGPQGQGGKDHPATGIGGTGPGGSNAPTGPTTVTGTDLRNLAHRYGLPFDSRTGSLDSRTIAANPSEFTGKFGNFVGELVDFFIPGNAFDSQTGFDVSNVVTSVLNNMIPIVGPLSNLLGINLVDKLVETIADKPWVPEWAKKILRDHVEDQNKQNRKGQSGSTGGGTFLPSLPSGNSGNWFPGVPSWGGLPSGTADVGNFQTISIGGGGGGKRTHQLEETPIEYETQ